MKRILGIVGSPRVNGNTHVLTSRVLEGAEAGGAETGLVLLGKRRIVECDGCHRCWRGKQCGKKDDMKSLYRAIIDSDAIVFGTPVYWFGPSALMKALVDRLVYFNCPKNRALIRGKQTAAVIPLEDTDPETFKPVVEFFDRCFRYLEMDFAGTVIAPGVSGRGEILNHPGKLDEAYEMGLKLAR
jgi:multimeric flavodoxin WrbA